MNFRKLLYFLLVISISIFTLFLLCINIYATPSYKKLLTENVKQYIKDKYNEDINITDIKYYTYKKGLFNINNIDEAMYYASDQKYTIFYDIKSNKIYDNKQFTQIADDINSYINLSDQIDTYYSIDTLYPFQKKATHFDNVNSIYFFEKGAYYNGNIKEYLSTNNINVDLSISVQATPSIYSYRDYCLSYINSLKPYFDGGESSIYMSVYKEMRHNNSYIKNTICEVQSYQRKDNWFENCFEQNFVKISNSISASTLLNNYYFKSPEDCYFKSIDIPNNIKDYDSHTKTFNSTAYYINYNEKDILKYNLDTNSNILLKIDKNSFENGALKESKNKLYIMKLDINNPNKLFYSVVNSSISYEEGQYIFVNISPDSYIVLGQ